MVVNSDAEALARLCPLNVVSTVGKGSFGQVVVVSAADSKQYAVKIEKKNCTVPQLRDEFRILTALKTLTCVPRVYFYWEEPTACKMLFEKLGPNLEQVKHLINGDAVLWTAVRLVGLLAQIHACKYIHRDIKPENILLGVSEDVNTIGRNTRFFFVDFGLGKRFCEQDGRHVPFIIDKKLRGTARYASINTHRGYEQSRRDDLESLGYVFIYLCLKRLPWMGIKHQSAAVMDIAKAVGVMKTNISLLDLCSGCPPQIHAYMTYIQNLQFDQDPDYLYLEQCLKPDNQKNIDTSRYTKTTQCSTVTLLPRSTPTV